jgi:hypothetical protein
VSSTARVAGLRARDPLVLALRRAALPLVGHPLALVGQPLAFVGGLLAAVRRLLAAIRLPPARVRRALAMPLPLRSRS